ncbi:Acetyl-CoA synthetase-like protein [Coniochaeta hoffmannii]|uniref:Acetyl-CoA synthetase-like protein n=1 Tax=Coniochaeta hoffmannii TaxID=91930 RepID=A0AA38VSX0_9PEZI|nr:Acetyl-CoA synthetase-like protein [Coniochaeta hoffmannii]
MAAQGTKLAYSGHKPGYVPQRNAFDWALGQPFQQQSDHTPPDRIVPPIEPNRPIFVDHKTDRALTHAQIRKDALAVAAGLRSLGLDANDLKVLPPTPTCSRPEIAPIVVVQLPNCLPYAPILLGIFASGLTATLVSPALTSSEIAWVLQSARPRVIITSTTYLPAMTAALDSQTDKAYFSSLPIFTYDPATDVYPSPPKSPSPRDWTSLLSAHPMRSSHPLPYNTPTTRTAIILWSSGTSGRSKGVLLSHHTLNFTTASLWHDADFYQGRRQHWLGYVPFYHVFGLANSFLLSLCAGSTTYVMPSFNLEAVLAAVPRRGITYFHMAPPVAVMLAKSPLVEKYARSGAFRTVAAGITGGAPLGHEVVVEVYRRLGFRIKLGYGLSETGSTSLQRGLSEEEMHAAAGDSGLPHWGTEVLIDADGKGGNGTIRVAKVNESGEILIRGPGVMMAYLPDHAVTTESGHPDMSTTLAALTPEGWFRTGDIGHIDEQGRLSITDRLKELIKVRAYQVAPAELEAVLCSSELVADAGVVGVYDPSEATEWPRAYVVARDQQTSREGLEKLAQELRVLVEKRAARYKWLTGGIVFVEQIPKSPSGKILRRLLKEGKVTGTEVQVYEKKVRHAKL